MKEFRVTLSHRAGELARVTEILAQKQINLKSVAGFAEGNKAVIALVGHDVNALRQALQDARIQVEEVELLTVAMEDEPGQLAEFASKLSAGGINLNSIYVLGRENQKVQVGFTTDKVAQAKKLIG